MTTRLVSYCGGVTQEGSDQLMASESICPEGQSHWELLLLSFLVKRNGELGREKKREM
jgi:hypothetical protein